MLRSFTVVGLVLALAACGSSDDDAEPASTDQAAATEAAPADEQADEAVDEVADEAAEEGGDDAAEETAVPGPGDAVGTLTGPDLDIAVAGRCTYDVSDLASSDIASADVRGLDPAGVEWPARFGLSGIDSRNTQLNINGTQVVVRWPEPGLVEQSTDEGSYVLDSTIGRLVVTTADGYELNISCFER